MTHPYHPPTAAALPGLAAAARHHQQLATAVLQRPTAEHLLAWLHAHAVHTWWARAARHSTATGLAPARTLARYATWIRAYLDDPTPAAGDEQQALYHLQAALHLIRRAAAREFLRQATRSEVAGER